MKGMSVDVYRNSYADSTLGGVTSAVDRCHLVGIGVAPVFEESGYPVLVLLDKKVFNRNHLFVIPRDEEGQWAFGGNFIYSSDSRFPSPYPIPVHDRDLNKEAR